MLTLRAENDGMQSHALQHMMSCTRVCELNTMNIIDCVIHNKPDELKALLANGANPNETEDSAKITPLHHAAQRGYLDCAELLLTAGADPQAKNAAGETPIDIAILHHHKALWTLLLNYVKSSASN